MILTARFAALTLALFVLPQALRATDSSLDASFVTTISPGLTPTSYPAFTSGTGAVNAVALQSDGAILAGGNVSRYQTSGNLSALKRVLPSGALDTTFNPGGGVGLATSTGQPEVNRLLVDSLDRIYVTGTFDTYDGTGRSCILRLLANGNIDTSFTPTGMGGVTRFGRALALQEDGKLLVGGVFTSLNGTFRKHVARLNTDGTLDTSFDPNTALSTCNSVFDIAIQPDGKILVGGSYSRGGYESGQLLTRLNPDGSLDPSFVPAFANASGGVQEIALLPDGRVVVTGFLELPAPYADAYLACFNPDGSIDTTFMANMGSGPAGWSGGNILIQPDGAIIIMGRFLSFDGSARAPIARLFPDGTLDTSFTPLPYAPDNGTNLTHFYTGAIQPDGKLVVGGWFDRVTDPLLETFNLTRIVNEYSPSSPGTLRLLTPTAAVAENAGSITLYVSRFSGLTGAVSVDYSVAGITATAGSDFTTTSGTLSWAAGEGGFKSITIPVLQDTTVEGSETFSVTLSSPTGGATLPPSAAQTLVTIRDDDSAPEITQHPASVSLEQGASFKLSVRYESVPAATVQWQRDPDGAGPQPFADIPEATNIDYTVQVADLVLHAGDYRAIVRSSPNGTPVSVTSNPATVAVSVPAGSVVTTFAPSVGFPVSSSSIDASGRIVIGGFVNALRLLADGTVDPSFVAPTFDNTVSAVFALAEGKVMVGGFFNTVNGTAKPDLARLNADGSLDTTYTPALPTAASGNLSVYSFAPGTGGKYYVGFGSGGGLRRYHGDGSLDISFNPSTGIGGNLQGNVSWVKEMPNGQLYVAHTNGANGLGFSYQILRLNANGTQDSSFAPPALNWDVKGIDVLPDGRIAIAGRFTTVAGVATQRVALLNNDGTLDPSFDFTAGASSAVHGVAYRDGRLLIWGEFATVAGAAPRGLARLNLDGSVDPNFAIGDGTNGAVFAGSYTTSGDIFVAGAFSTFKGVSRQNAALLVGNPHIGAIGFAPPRVTTIDAGATLALTLRRYGPTTEAVSITYTTADLSAIAGEDYQAATGTVSWLAGDSADKTVNVTISADSAVESTESFRVVLSSPTGPVTAAASATVTLIDANTPVTFTTQPTDASLTEGQSLTLTSTATSPTAMTYQWYRNNQPIPSATSPTYTVAATGSVDAGTYFLRVTNAAGFVDTNTVTVTVALDPARRVSNFNFTTSINGNVRTLALLPTGGAYVGGDFSSVPGLTSGKYLMRVNDDGSLDTSYNPQPNSSVATAVLQPDGKLLIGGSFSQIAGVSRAYIARLNADGSLDTAFSSALGTGPNSTVTAIALLPDGRIAIGGAFYSVSNVSSTGYLAILKADGSVDTSFTSVANNQVTALAAQPDGKLLVGGYFTTYGTRFARISTTGTLDTSFANSAATSSSVISKIVVLPDNRIAVLGTNLFGGSDFEIVNTDGMVAQNINTTATFYDVVAQDNGKLATVGSFTLSGAARLARFAPTGSPASYAIDNTFATGSGLNNLAYTIAANSTGQLWIGGAFTTYNGVSANRLIKLNGEPVAVVIANQPTDATVNPDATLNFSVSATGTAALTYQWSKNGVALSDDSRISGATSAALAIANATDADEGDYTVVVTNSTAGRSVTSRAAAAVVLGAPEITDAPSSSEFDAGATLTVTATVRGVAPLTYEWRRNGQLLVNGGRISGADTANLNISGAEVTDGGTFTLTVTNSLGFATTQDFNVSVIILPGLPVPAFTSLAANSTVHQILPLPDGGALVAGNFNTSTGLTGANGTAGGPYLERVKPNGEIDSTFTVAPDNDVHRLAFAPDGGIIGFGYFSTVSGHATQRLFRLNPDLTLDTTWTQSGYGLTGIPQALAIDSIGRIYVGATYSGYSNAYWPIAERFSPQGVKDTSFSWSGNNSIYHIDEILVDSQDRVLIAGNSFSSKGLVRLLPSGASDPTFATNVIAGSSYSQIHIGLQSDGKIIVSNSQALPGLRRLTADGAVDNSFTNSQTYINDFAVLYNDRIVTVGNTIPGSGVNAIARFQPDGTPTTLPGATTGFNGSPTTIRVAESGTLWIGGFSNTTYNGQPATRIIALNGDVPNLHISRQPTASTILDPGATATFTARAVGTSAITYRWLKDGVELTNGGRISGADTATLTITGLINTDSANYTVRVSNATGGSVTSSAAQLLVRDAPVVLAPIQSLSLTSGNSATFTVAAEGVGPLSYVWNKNGTPIPGANSGTYTIPSVNRLDAGLYSVTITNTLGSITTAGAALSVGTLPDYSPVKINTGGTYDEFRAVAKLPDGRYYVGGSFSSIDGHANVGLARFLADGSIDTSFVSPYNSGTASVLAAFPDGRVFVHGLTSSSNPFASHTLVNADGTLATFTSTALSNIAGIAQTAAIGPDGNIYVSYTYAAGGSNRPMIVKLSPTGDVLTAFNGDGTGGIYDFGFLSGGRIAIAGNWTKNSVTRYVDILDTSFVPDTNFAAVFTLNNRVFDLAVLSDGDLLIGGQFSTVNGVSRNYLARINQDGTTDTTFLNGLTGPNGGSITDIVPTGDGKLLLLNTGTQFNGTVVNNFVRIDETGLIDSTYPRGTSPNIGQTNGGYANTALVRNDGAILLAGYNMTFKGVALGGLGYLTAPEDGTLAIIAEPAAITQPAGSSVILTVAARGAGPLTFQWYKENIAIPGATATSYTIPSLAEGDAASYTVIVTSGATTATSAPATITIGNNPTADTLTDFLADAGVPANLRGPNDDADGDGLANLLEYALDLNPFGNGGAFTGIAPSTATTPTHLQFTYRRVRNDVTYLVETCDDLATGSWTSIGVDQGTPAGDGTTTASLPISGGSRFLRLSVSR